MFESSNYTVFSRRPLYIVGDECTVKIVDNTYDDLEVIRVYYFGEDNYRDTPIEPGITFVPDLGMFFYSSEGLARQNAITSETYGGRVCIMENCLEGSKKNKAIYKFKEKEGNHIEQGLYVIDSFDDELPETTWLKNICYVNEKKEVCSPKKASDELNEYLRDYLLVNNIETRHDLEKERLIFEVFVEKEYVYINHFFVHISLESFDVFYFTRIMSYPVFCNKLGATMYRNKLSSGGNNEMSLEQAQKNLEKCAHFDRVTQARKETMTKISQIALQYAWEHLDQIIDLLKKYGPKIASKIVKTTVTHNVL